MQLNTQAERGLTCQCRTSNPSMPTNDLKYTVLMWFAPYCRHLLAKRLLSEGSPRLFPLRTPSIARHPETAGSTNVRDEVLVGALSWKMGSPQEHADGHNTDARQGTTTTERERIRLTLETQYPSNDLEIARQIMTGSGLRGKDWRAHSDNRECLGSRFRLQRGERLYPGFLFGRTNGSPQ